MTIEFLESVLCDSCSNANRGVRVSGWAICLHCIQDDVGLLKQIVRLAMPEIAAKLEAKIREGCIR
jgi:hypothetical protein